MRTLKRILAVIVMVISVLLLVLSLASIAGTWIVRDQLTTGLVGIVTAAETRATTVKQGLDRLDTALTQARDQVAAVEQDVQAFGADVEQNRPLFTAISDRVGLNLSPLVDSAREIMTTIREAVAAVNSTIEAINAIPFVSVPVPELESLKKLSQDVDNFRTEVQDLRTAMDQRRIEIIDGAVSIITTPTSQIGSTLDGMRTTVSGYSRQLGAVQEGLSSFKSAIGRWLAWTAVILSLILLWLALSQAGLFVLGWRAFSGQDLLPRKQQEPPTSSDE
jgi:predicted  nucleic acid-binding Zn-ribbon protein